MHWIYICFSQSLDAPLAFYLLMYSSKRRISQSRVRSASTLDKFPMHKMAFRFKRTVSLFISISREFIAFSWSAHQIRLSPNRLRTSHSTSQHSSLIHGSPWLGEIPSSILGKTLWQTRLLYVWDSSFNKPFRQVAKISRTLGSPVIICCDSFVAYS